MAKRRGKSDHVPGNPLADYLMQHRFAHVTTSGAGDSNTVIQTGMRRPMIPSSGEAVEAWEIHAVTIRPQIVSGGVATPYAAATCWCHFQLQYGQQADVIDESLEDFDDLIAGGSFHLDLATSGANSHFWPMALDVVNPRPVFAEYLTFTSETPNVVPVNAAPFTVSIWYAPIILSAGQVELMLAMRARL
jgi:hypothetical protein